MNNSGDAAEQIVRMSLETTEIVLRLSGSAAKNVAAAIYSVLKNKDKNKIKGRQRLTSMLKSGKELKVFTVSEEHLKQFAKEAKRYGVVYCALRGKDKADDGLVDVMVRAEDAAKINRIVERFKLATVDAASIKKDIEKTRNGKEMLPNRSVLKAADQNEMLLDEMLSVPDTGEYTAVPTPMLYPNAQTMSMNQNPKKNEALSEPILKQREKAEGDISEPSKQSVREQLAEIRASRKKQEGSKESEKENAFPARQTDSSSIKSDTSQKRTVPKDIIHKQPTRKKGSKKVR